MCKFIIWGTGSFYDNYIAHYHLSEEINVIGFVTGLDTVCKEMDGKPLFKPEEIKDIEFDYIIIAIENQTILKDIKNKIVNEYNISKEKCINGKVFRHPCFNWQRFLKIISNPPTLITEACYGGYIYNQLGMQFYSPFINTRISESDYLTLISNLDYYLHQNIYKVREIQKTDDMRADIFTEGITWGKMGYPIAQLGGVKLHAIHTQNLELYIEEWNRRKQRINWDNIWVLMIIENEEIAEKFAEIKGIRKLGFYYRETGIDNLVCLNDWGNFSSRINNGHDFLSYVHHQIWDDKVFRSIDIFKMLTGEKDFVRMI